MINTDLSSWLRPSPPKSLPKLRRYLRTLTPKLMYAQQRASHTVPITNGLRLIEQILSSDPVVTMTYDSDPWRALGDNIDSVIRSLGRFLDPEQSGVLNRHMFISPHHKCLELVFPTQRQDPYGTLPYEKTFTDKWKRVRPLRLLETDAPDLTFEFSQGYIFYRTQAPTLAVFGLDIFSLVIKYLVYRTSLPKDADFDYAIRHYIHDEVLLPCFLTDPLSLWLRNQYQQVASRNGTEHILEDGYYRTVTGNTLGSEYNPAMDDVLMLLNQLSERSVSVSSVLSSLWLDADGTVSIRDYITDLFANYSPPYQQQYMWLSGMAYLGWIEWFISLSQRQKDVPDALTVKHRLQRDVALWINAQPWQHVNDLYCRDYLRQRIERIMLYLDSSD